MKYENPLIEKFKTLLKTKEKNENDIQRFLEKNTELIPLPFILNHRLHFNSFISKFKISNSNVTDFAYLTKCSDYWHFVLMELESPKERIFAKRGDTYVFHHKFNNSYDQILHWKSYIDKNKDDVIKRVKCLRLPLGYNPVRFRYVLVFGRSKEKINSEIKRNLVAQKDSEDIRILTYDSIISELLYNPFPTKQNILSHWRDGFKIKYLYNMNTHIFGYVKPEFLKISKKQKKELILEGFDINSWEEGKLLEINNKLPFEKRNQIINRKIKGK